jgi:PPK2 family polyphosphate:nucleotide phosphotransferase
VASAFVEAMRIEPGSAPKPHERHPGARPEGLRKQEGLERLAELHERIEVLHARLGAEATRPVLLVLQGVDASGKDGTIKHVFRGVNPQGCRVVSFKVPVGKELAHDYLWRVHAACPERGELGIFNRSHYEDVIAVRVRKLAPEAVWRKRHAEIREFERLLVEEGTTVVKLCLHVSKEEQRKRLQERLDNPEKRWKFRLEDLDDRALWDDFALAYEDAIRDTSTEWAQWYVVPSDHNWVRNLAVAEILVDTFERLDPQLPPPDPQLEGVRVD